MSIARVGVIGGGQLAWMMAQAAPDLGIELLVQTPHADDPATALAAKTILAPITDATATAQLATECDVITFENEFVDLEALAQLSSVAFRPALSALAPLLDKYTQRQYLQNLGIPTPTFAAVDRLPFPLPFPVVMKARRHGYDGQGTVILRDRTEAEAIWQRWGKPSVLIEEFVPFDRELAVMAARSVSGEIAVYPVVETYQEQQVCRWAIAPARIPPQVAEEIAAIARAILESLDVVGIFGIELFLTAAGKVLVNEIAPRTHNSGHLTIDACATSQFAQHLRAVSGLSLGSSHLTCDGAVMVNLLGHDRLQIQLQPDEKVLRDRLAAIPHAHLYWYGKIPRPGRKLGHVTVLLDTTSGQSIYEQSGAIVRQIETIWYEYSS